MKLERLQRMARFVIILFGTLTVVAGAATYWLNMQTGASDAHHEALSRVRAYIQEHGLTPQVQEQLEALPRDRYWTATFVLERQGETPDPASDRIVAASPPELVGRTERDFTSQFGPPGSTLISGWGDPIDNAADGRSYVLWTWHENEFFWHTFWLILAMVALVITWFASTGWLILDAQGRQASVVAGWVLLSLLSGPIAVAVWLISRPAQTQPEVCPGCGADALPDATYCVHCGYGLRPSCSGCGKVVEPAWTYCPTCRTHLTEG